MFEGISLRDLRCKELGDQIVVKDLQDLLEAGVVVIGVRGQSEVGMKICLEDFNGLFIL